MTPQKQAFRHKPEEGVFGDCFRTAIACLLDVPRDFVPHDHEAEARELAQDAAGNPDGSQTERMNAWLARRGLTLIDIAFNAETCSLDDVLNWTRGQNPHLHFLLAGTSRTGCGHYVIAKAGEIVWDPSLTDAGIVGPQEGHYWLTFIARLT